MNTALHTHLGRPSAPGFLTTTGDFFGADVVGSAPQIFAEFALGKCTELAFEITDIGVVNISINDVANLLTIDLLPQPVRALRNIGKILTPAFEQAAYIFEADRFLRFTAGDDVFDFRRCGDGGGVQICSRV